MKKSDRFYNFELLTQYQPRLIRTEAENDRYGWERSPLFPSPEFRVWLRNRIQH